MRTTALATIILAGTAGIAAAAVKTQTVEYKHGNITLEGYLAWDDTIQGKRPGVLVVHEWTGLGEYAKARARKLAEMGYVAFAADIYGKGVHPRTPQEAAAESGKFKQDRKLMRARVQAGLGLLLANPLCDAKRVAAIGYCFGGTCVLELARSGAEVAGVVSFHGGLDTPTPEDAKQIKCKVLVLHGGDDPHVPAKDVEAFENEMRAGGVDWQLVAYGGAVHGFTNPASGNDKSRGAAYDEKADRRSWEAMKAFFAELFKPAGGHNAPVSPLQADVAGDGASDKVTRKDLDAYIAMFKDKSKWHYGERTKGELAGTWVSEDREATRIIFGADGSFSEDFNGNMTAGLYAISDKGRIVAVSKWKGNGLGSHFQLDGNTITGPKGPLPNVRWKRTATTK